jgi:uncharacterized protein
METPLGKRLLEALGNLPAAAVAVSGGVDSLTLATFVHQSATRLLAYHAISPAVPQAATARIKSMAQEQGWTLFTVDAGEFKDARYLANPVDRCFFCKSNLYESILAKTQFKETIFSGTNTDDLDDYRPGLKAAEEKQIRHPFVEAGIDKAGVRALARALGLGDLAELPASPCLASRVETGIGIEAPMLAAVDAIESLVRKKTTASHVRCRIKNEGVEIQMEKPALAQLSGQERGFIAQAARIHLARAGLPAQVGFAPYKKGSAFLTVV